MIRRSTMSGVYVFLADGFEEIEGLTVVDLLRRAGIEVKTVSVMENIRVTGSHKIEVTADSLFAENDYADAKMLVLPGGMPGTKNLQNHKGLTELLQKHNAEGKKLAAICAAPSVLGQLGMLKGIRATCYPGFEDMLIGAETGTEKVAVDKNFTTSRGLGTAIEFSLEIIRQLKDKETAKKIEDSIMYDNY